jgi:HAD superfamily hydrolase (TIGR01509 family)
MNLRLLNDWIFDMDGTLTVPMHDFDRMRETLGLPQGRPILETIKELPPERAVEVSARLDELEFQIALEATPRTGAERLLRELLARKARLGILTRNSRENAFQTLRVCGLLEFFDPQCVLGRENVSPKPDPEGICRLLHIWGAEPDQAVIVGDYLFDMLAGRQAGTATVYVGREPAPDWLDHIDVWVKDLEELRSLAVAGD